MSDRRFSLIGHTHPPGLDGILPTNLLDKTANETVTGAYTFSADTVFSDGADDSLTIQLDGTDANFNFASIADVNFNSAGGEYFINGNHFNVRGAGAIRAWNSGNTDNIAMSHDGSDANFDCVNTVDINFTGYSGSINWLEARPHYFAGGGSRGGYRAESISMTDDSTAVFESFSTYRTLLIVTSFNRTASGIAHISATSTPDIVQEGAACHFGATNLNVDGGINIWPSSATAISIKNRLGSTRNITVHSWGI